MNFIAKPENSQNKGHYSPGVIMNNILYVSGQLPVDPKTNKLVEGDIEEQTQRSLQNVENVLQRAGVGKEQVGLCRVYLSDIALWDRVNGVYAAFFGAHMPARVVVPTRDLHFGALVEIEAMAELPAQSIK